MEELQPKKSVEARIFLRMKRCGKFLLKRAAEHQEEDTSLLDHLTDEEKKQLARLLKKCTDAWKPLTHNQ